MNVLQKTRRLAIVGLAAALIFFLFAGVALAKRGHDFSERDCNVCHREKNGLSTPPLSAPRGDVSSQCVNCHTSCDVWSRHDGRPVAGIRMMDALPLTGDQKMGCVTCHDPHLNQPANAASAPSGYLRIGVLKRELCLNCHLYDDVAKGSVEVSTPPDKVIVNEDHIPLIGRTVDLAEDRLQVKVNGASFSLPVRNGVFYTRLALQEGMNRIEIVAEGGTLWRGEVLQSLGESLSENYGKVYRRHQTGSLDECLACHEGEGGEFTVATGSTPGLCYDCHEPLNEKRFLHGPIAVGECLTCHDPHGGIGRNNLRERESVLCFSCHDRGNLGRHSRWGNTVAENSCSSCHDPHQSDTRFFTRSASIR